MSVLKVSQVRKIYNQGSEAPSKALDGVSFRVNKGEFVGIMGPSGAGKSTLLNVIATIDTVSSGTIMIGDEEISGMQEPELSDFRRNKLGFVFQDYNLLDTLTLRENIALPLIMCRKHPEEINKAVGEMAWQLGIRELLDKYPSEVSGGQRQRASAARAMINAPELILADEPTGALDSKSAGDLLECIQDLNETCQATILLVTHDALAASYCNRILFIKDGILSREIHKTGTRKQFYDEIIRAFAEIGGDSRDIR